MGGRVPLHSLWWGTERSGGEYHKLAVFLVGVGGVWSFVLISCLAILVKNDSGRNFERPPSHPALCRQRVCLMLGATGSASIQQL